MSLYQEKNWMRWLFFLNVIPEILNKAEQLLELWKWNVVPFLPDTRFYSWCTKCFKGWQVWNACQIRHPAVVICAECHTDSGFCKCFWSHEVISTTESDLFLRQRRLRAWRSRPSNIGFRLCPLRTKISLNPLMILCLIDDEMPKFFAILHWLPVQSFTKCRAPISERLCFSGILLLKRVILANSWVVLIVRCPTRWFFSITPLYPPLLPFSNFLKHAVCIKFKWSECLQSNCQFQHLICSCILNMHLYCLHFIAFWFDIHLTAIQVFWKWDYLYEPWHLENCLDYFSA